jgi:hypothetical protein
MDRHDGVDTSQADVAALCHLDVQSQTKHGVQSVTDVSSIELEGFADPIPLFDLDWRAG